MPKTDAPPAPRMRTAVAGRRGGEFVLPQDDWFTPAVDHPDYLRVLYFGREGSTKTTCACTMANVTDGKILILNAEGGFKVKPLQTRGIDISNIVVYPPDTGQSGHKFTRSEMDAVFNRVASEMRTPGTWGGTIWDSASRLVTNVLEEVSAARVARYKRRGMDDDNVLVDDWFTDRDDYGVMSKMIRDQLRKYLDLHGHWAGTALLRREKDKDTGKPMYGPDVNPGLWGSLLGDPDIVIGMVGEDELGPARGLTVGNTRWRAKDRFNVLPRVMANPTFERILGYYNEEIREEDDPLQKELTAAALRSFDGPRNGLPVKDKDEEDDGDDD